ncbi:hypothetical protein [Arenicella xantha]|uniref:Uncharacterized protein n=1 Tax=Arenicella xantha TaxID=644221 RepID=A0A395JPH6_9GAMM|nr:hypothetical protein [Arenicella xantha]RBP53397.1 hypothetical protein DFR28_101783 [Arenicella xantha]
MSNKNPVLPNFLKVLTVATFALIGLASYAGQHESEQKPKQERIVELKEMTNTDHKLAPVESRKLTDADAAKAEDALAEDINAATKKLNEEPQTWNTDD